MNRFFEPVQLYPPGRVVESKCWLTKASLSIWVLALVYAVLIASSVASLPVTRRSLMTYLTPIG